MQKIDSLREAEDDIRVFLELYPNDPRAAETPQITNTKSNSTRCERQFERRVKGLVSTEDLLPIERAYLEAISYERISPEQCIAKLQALVDLYQYSSEMTGPTGDCLTLAHRRIDQFKQEISKNTPPSNSIFIQKRLDEADSLLSTDPKHAQAMYRAVIELYTDKPWAADAVRRAQTALDKISPRP